MDNDLQKAYNPDMDSGPPMKFSAAVSELYGGSAVSRTGWEYGSAKLELPAFMNPTGWALLCILKVIPSWVFTLLFKKKIDRFDMPYLFYSWSGLYEGKGSRLMCLTREDIASDDWFVIKDEIV